MKGAKITVLNRFSNSTNQNKAWERSATAPQFLHCFSSTTSTVSNRIDSVKRAIRSLGVSSSAAKALKSYKEKCVFLLRACSSQGWVHGGRSLHGHLIKMGISSDRSVAAKILLMYLNFEKYVEVDVMINELGGFDLVVWNCMISASLEKGRVDKACRLFDEMLERNKFSWTGLVAGLMRCGRVNEAAEYFGRNPFRDVVSWTAMIHGYVQNGMNCSALKVFCRMLDCGILPNEVTFTCIVKGCIGLGDFGFGKSVLGLILKCGLENNLSVCNCLITFHLRMGETELARRIFDRMEERDVVSWTSILDVYVEMGKLIEARGIFDDMPERNEISWSTMIARYSQNGDAEEALILFKQMLHDGIRPNMSCFSSILSVSATLAALELGMCIHSNAIKFGSETDVSVGSSLIDMYCKCGMTEDGRWAFDSILVKNVVSWNSMVFGYSLNGLIDEARELFEKIPNRNTISWNTMIAGFVQSEYCDKVLDVFNEMLLSGERPNASTFSSVLRACASIASLEKGKNIHGKIIKLGIHYEVFMGTALIDMYAKSGDIESSRSVFDRMHEKNEITWTAMIQGLADNGLAMESLILFEEMQRSDVIPTELMFLAVLFACSHCGLVDKGFRYFESMEKIYGIKPRGRHYTCMVDLLARSGRLREAETFIEAMPFQPEANAWAALLSGCSTYKNEEIAERIAKKLRELGEENSAGYVLLSNIYASAGRWKDVAMVRKLLRDKGLKKMGGCSWIEVRNEVCSFHCEDGQRLLPSGIYGILELLMSQIGDVQCLQTS
ncbi:hypothetical protein Sjap_016159 [Stephania japonica]|uniref:Chlororespiratory reduction 21 n=1 Tax=Stephania japonica TaxID=461633 RepID=A0AAP0IMH5_9MAGN